jgi:hypothetical protein
MTEDVGTTKRKAMTPQMRLKVWENHKGICALCSGKIDGVRERWIVEHLRGLAERIQRPTWHLRMRPAPLLRQSGSRVITLAPPKPNG